MVNGVEQLQGFFASVVWWQRLNGPFELLGQRGTYAFINVSFYYNNDPIYSLYHQLEVSDALALVFLLPIQFVYFPLPQYCSIGYRSTAQSIRPIKT